MSAISKKYRIRDNLKSAPAILTLTTQGSNGSTDSTLHVLALPDDILYIVIGQLSWPYDIHSLCSVSKRFNALSTPSLYRTVVFPYARPQALHALLTKLETSPELCAYVTALVFDDVAKPFKPDIPPLTADFESYKSSQLENRLKEPIARRDWLLDQIHHKLYSVLPLMNNIQSLHLKRIHPVFLSPPLSHVPPTVTASKRVKDAVLNRVPIRQWRTYQYPHEERMPAAIAMFLTHCHSLTRLIIHDPLSLRSYWPHSLISNLTVLVLGLNLDSVIVELDAGDARAMQFNSLLRKAKNLKKLCILTTWMNLTLLLDDVYLPHLESLEWFHYRAKNPLDAQTFHEFLEHHSPTLKHLALAPVAYIVGNWGYTIDNSTPCWLSEPPSRLLPNLETFRLHNWLAWAKPQPIDNGSITYGDRLRLAKTIMDFILKRDGIVDVALTEFPSRVAKELIEGLNQRIEAKRRAGDNVISRILVGKDEKMEMDSRVPRLIPLTALPLSLPSPSGSPVNFEIVTGFEGDSGTGIVANLVHGLTTGTSHALQALNPASLFHGHSSNHNSHTSHDWSVAPQSENDKSRAKAYWAFIRKRDFLMEAYHSYHVMFQGMELEGAGFRPYLLPRKRGAKRDYWR
ncbi:hypothetical protein CPB86DRAFT_327955 [Serendipita vermifera]|nr:hypothetical protein CPB86DRAFT_327955 [Serendipita vermifera]